MADFDFLEEFGVSVGEAEQPQSVYEKFILKVGNQVTADLREYIQQNAMNTGALAQSVVYFPTGALSFEIQAEDRKSTRLNSSHSQQSRMPSSA